MNLANLPTEIQEQIINYLNINDLAFLSLVNKYYNTLLGRYRFLQLKDLSQFLFLRNLQLLLAEDKYSMNAGGISPAEDLLLQHMDYLRQLATGIFKFHLIAMGGILFEKLHNHLPNSKRISLVLNTHSSGVIPWDNIDGKDLKKIMKLHLCTNSQLFHGALTNLHRFTGLQELILDRSMWGPAYLIDWATIFHSVIENSIDQLSILGRNLFGNAAVIFASFVGKSNLTTLNISNCAVNDPIVMELSKNLSETKLEKLKLNGNNITDSGAIALAKGLTHSKLNHLDLSYNRIGREGLCKLSEAIPLSKLNYFEIEANDHQPDDLAELYKVLDNSCLVELKVPEGGPLSENALINSINRSKVEELEVNISPDNLGAFFVALQGSAVKKLTLAFEDAIVERIDIVSQFLGTCTVKELYFNTNFTYSSDEVSCSKLFVNQSKTGSLTLLDISDIALDGKEFNMIANQLPNTNLEALEILYPDISDADLYNLGVNIAQSALVSFTLCATAYTNYRLTSEGVIEFIKTVNGTRLRHLEFSSSNLSKQDHRKIRDILGNSPSLVIYFGS